MASLAEMLIGKAMQGPPDTQAEANQAILGGAGIAQRQQEINQRQQQIDDQHQQLQAAKVEKYMDAIEKAQKYSGKAQTQYINNYLPAYSKALGIDGMFPAEAMKFNMSTPEGIARMQTLITDTRANPQNATDNLKKINDPEQFADVPFDQRQQYFPQILKAQDEGLKDAATVGKQQKQLDFEAQKDQQTFQTHIADKGNSELAPVISDKVHINSALNAINRVNDAYAKGETPSRQDVTLAATGLATTVAKRINPTEFENIMHVPGAENWTIDQWNKYIAGGVNANVVKGLSAAIKDQSSQVDQELGSKRALIESEVKNSRYSGQAAQILAPINDMINKIPQPTSKKKLTKVPPPANATVTVNGHDLTVDQAKAYLAQSPNGKDAPAVSAALKAAGVQ